MTITPTKPYNNIKKVINASLIPTVLVFSACATATPVHIDSVEKTSSSDNLMSTQTLKIQSLKTQTVENVKSSSTLPTTVKTIPASQIKPPSNLLKQMPSSVKTIALKPSAQVNKQLSSNTIVDSQTKIQSTTKVIAEPHIPAPNTLAGTHTRPSIVKEVAASPLRDISDQYTSILEGVPIIESPKNCGNGDLEIRVTVTNIKKIKGSIVADLHDDKKENFLVWDKVVLRVRVPVTASEVSFCMPLTKSGDYAVAFYQDKNNNSAFDKNFLGIPKERFGMSNNPKFGMRSPKYEEAVFPVSENGADLHIKMLKASDIF